MLVTDRKLNFLGFRPTGDLADLTCYTSKRNRIVWFPKAPPQKPPSVLQIRNRNRFRLAAAAWQRKTQEQRNEWNAAARHCHLSLSGYTLWVFWQLRRDEDVIRTIERLSRRNLLDT